MQLILRSRVQLLVFALAAAVPLTATAQSGLRQSLELLDRDGDGYLEPDEITPLSRPYLERIARARRISLDRRTRIDEWQQAARIYYAMQNGTDDDNVRVSEERSVEPFGLSDDDIMVPEFGLPDVKYPYTKDDLEDAERAIERYDRNRDGYLSRREADRGRWRYTDPFLMDFNKDDQLSRLELAQRYARRRLVRDDAGELIQRARRVGNGIRPSVDEDDDDDRRRRSRWSRSGGSKYWLTAGVLDRFDANRNGQLESDEVVDLGMPAGQIDIDRDGVLSRDELFAYLSDLQDQTGDLTEGLPGWYYELDGDRDGQVSLMEFAAEPTDARVNEFTRMDTNQDGLLSPIEVLSTKGMTGGRYANTNAEILPPRKTIVSEINVEDDFIIADMDVQLSITHTYTSYLDGYLTGPDGQRIELFTAVGSNDDHFNETVFDDQAREPINKARPPFEGTFIPEGTVKRQPGLSTFNGKSIKGVWQLTIRCSRSDRFGMLHEWALIARPDEESLLDERQEEVPDTADESTAELTSAAADFSSGVPGWNDQMEAGQLKASMPGDWSSEVKAELANRLRRPTPQQWAQMSETERQAKLEARKQAIDRYKKMLGGE
ncbi:calcium sensor EFh [Roseiconus nitratireducens]|uniref:Calcium sensor EFh n=1 Tax=Roseiconus nitratireducens TaxID=2605748 RepID=A0A5M6DE72_9BACT|nr:proprotein convertase P-domain-containing protein [Roseiconus nitratireducens]KAA5544700.1 calcium sensor EFh [Roseiconus nitratireducens]